MELMRFSNPDQVYPEPGGDPMGVPGDAPTDATDGPAVAVRNLDDTRAIVAKFRPGTTRCAYGLSARTMTLDAAGGQSTLDVTAGPTCEWDISAYGGFLSTDTVSGAGRRASIDEYEVRRGVPSVRSTLASGSMSPRDTSAG